MFFTRTSMFGISREIPVYQVTFSWCALRYGDFMVDKNDVPRGNVSM